MLRRRPDVVPWRAEARPDEPWVEHVRVRLEFLLAHFFPFLVRRGGFVRAAGCAAGSVRAWQLRLSIGREVLGISGHRPLSRAAGCLGGTGAGRRPEGTGVPYPGSVSPWPRTFRMDWTATMYLLPSGTMRMPACAKMAIGHRNRATLAADGATGIPWVLGGLSLVAASAAIVAVFL